MPQFLMAWVPIESTRNPIASINHMVIIFGTDQLIRVFSIFKPHHGCQEYGATLRKSDATVSGGGTGRKTLHEKFRLSYQ